MPSHLVRAGSILALALTGFLFFRSASTMMSIEVIGLSKVDDTRAWATRPVANQASGACADCHKETNERWADSAHITVKCENCHGVTKTHVEKATAGESAATVPLTNPKEICVTCHGAVSSRPAGFPQVNPVDHPSLAPGMGASCVSCHNAHDPGIPPDITHTLEGRAACLECHGDGQWKPAPRDHADLIASDTTVVPDTCLKCHSVEEEGG